MGTRTLGALGVGIALAALAFPIGASAAPGDLDSQFGKGGIVRLTPFGDVDAVAIDDQGRIVVAGLSIDGSGLGLARYAPDGTFDHGFGHDGIAEVNPASSASVSDILIEPTGRILLGTRADGRSTLTAFNDDGSAADSFGNGGQATELRVSGTLHLASGTAGRLFVLGSAGGPAVQRLLNDGANDPSYGVDGVASAHGYTRGGALAVAPDDSVIVGVSVITRLTPEGTVDSSFGASGAVAIDSVDAVKTESLALGPGGEILVGALECDDPSQREQDCLESLVRVHPSGASHRQLAVGVGTLVNTLADGSLTLVGSYQSGGLPPTISLTHHTVGGRLITPFGIEGRGAALQGFEGLDLIDAATGANAEAVIGGGNRGPVVARFLLGSSPDADADADGVANSRDKCDLGFGPAPSGCRKAQRSLHISEFDKQGVATELRSRASSSVHRVQVSLFSGPGRRLVERQNTDYDPFAFLPPQGSREVLRHGQSRELGVGPLQRCT